MVEFLALSVLLLVPVVWLILSAGQVQAASYAAVGAADQAATVYITTTADPAAGSEAAVLAVLDDFGIPASDAHISQHCEPDCSSPGAMIGFTVQIQVPLPLMPTIGGFDPTLVTVEATSAQVNRAEP